MISFKINEERALHVAISAVSMLENSVFPFDTPEILPDAVLPDGMKRGGLEHALFLFYACSLDSLRPAKKVYKAMRGIVKDIDLKDLNLYATSYIEHNLIGKYLEKKGINKPAERLSYNANKIYKDYSGDPRNLRNGDIDGTLKEIAKFKGVGRGIASLIMKNYVKSGIWDFSPYEIPIKVDRHAIKISVGAGVIEFDPDVKVVRSDQIIKSLIEIYRKITSERNISAIKLDDALWGIGSQICVSNALAYCDLYCGIDCKTRPKADSKAVWIHPGDEAREMTLLLPTFKTYKQVKREKT